EASRCANTGNDKAYSITSSARPSSIGGTSRPIAFAALRLITSSNLVGCSTANSPGLAPLRILSTYTASRSNDALRLGPYVMVPPDVANSDHPEITVILG